MKFYSNKINNVASKFKQGEINSILLHGPDIGVKNRCVQDLVKSVAINSIKIPYESIIKNGLLITLNHRNLFAKDELYIVTSVPSKVASELMDLSEVKTYNKAIFVADELTPSSNIRKLFEKSESLASVGCYNESPVAIQQLVNKRLLEEKVKIDSQVKDHLVKNLNGDLQIIQNELDKLFLYLSDKKEVTLEDVQKIICDNTEVSADRMCLAFVSGNGKIYLSELEKILNENIPAIWVIRAIIRYYINLYIVLTHIELGESLSNAVSKLSPPIFFKYTDIFKQLVSRFKKSDVLKILELLNDAEIEAKSYHNSDKHLCEWIFFKKQVEWKK